MSICRNLRIRIFSLFVLPLAFNPAWGKDNYEFIFTKDIDITTIDNNANFPSNEIRRIFQDREGFMWFASTNGLIRYDAYDFTIFKSDLSTPRLLTDNSITALADDAENIWIGTSVGLNRLDKKTRSFSKVDHPKFIDLNINQIIAQNDSMLWLASNRGLIKYYHQKDSVVVYEGIPREPYALPSSDIRDIYMDSNGLLWVAMWNNGICQYNELEDNFIRFPRINKRNSVSVIFEDRSGNMWLGSSGSGLYRIVNKYSAEKAYYINYSNSPENEHSISDNFIHSINQDLRYKYIWVGHRGGISILTNTYDSLSFMNYSINSEAINLSGNDINTIYRDRNGIMWLGSMGGGVNKINLYNPSIKHNNIEEIRKKYGETFISYVHKEDNNTFWVGIKNKGLFIYDMKQNKFTHSSEIPGLKDLPTDITINCIKHIKYSDEIWLGVQNRSLIIINPNEGNPYISTRRRGIPGNRDVHCIYEDRNNNVWVGSDYGFSIKTSTGKIINKRRLFNNKIDPHIQDIAEDKDGNIWLSTKQQGVIKVKYENENLTYKQYYKGNNKCNSNDILSMHIDRSNNIWIGSRGGGLSRFIPEKDIFSNQNYKFNIHYDDIFNLFSDMDGNLWMMNYYAIMKLDASFKKSVEIFTNETENANVYSETSHPVLLFKNTFLLPGVKGFDIISSRRMYVNNDLPKVVITDIEISNESIFQRNISETYKYNEKEIILPHNKNNITIKFTALSFSNPQKQNYLYKLQGFENTWHNAKSNSRRAVYTNIPKGKYTFQVKASNENGLWNDVATELTVKIKPAVYDTWYAWTTYALVTLLLALVIIKNMLKRIELKNKIKIKEMQQITSEQLNQAKLKFFTNISHELLTPLSIVNCAIEEIEESRKVDKKQIEIITNNINRLTRLIRQILEFRKAENNRLKLKVSYGNISSLISTIANTNFKPLANKKQLHFSVLSNPEDIMGWFDPDKLDKIMYNLLSNAFKYNKAGGFVQVSLLEKKIGTERYIYMSVKDNGIGISEENLPHIFDRFFDGFYREQNTEGTGLGLSLTKSLVELHNGTISVESKIGEGSNFSVIIPIDHSSYREDQIDSSTQPAQENHYAGNTPGQQEKEPVEKTEAEEQYKPSQKLLLVEDNTELIEIMSMSLRSDYEIFTAGNGIEALEILSNNEIDIVVSDIMMPEMDGFELCNKIKNNEELSHIPIILLTAKNSEEDKIKGFESGADAFITKPFKSKMLKVRISNLISKREKTSSTFRSEDTIKLKNITYTSIDEKFMEKAIELVEEHISDTQFNFEIFVKEMNVSKSMLYRKIKNLTGMSTTEFIRNIRLKNACKILREKSVNISEVAYTVGFNDPKYFTSCFKKEFGILPTEYIRKFKDLEQLDKTSSTDS